MSGRFVVRGGSMAFKGVVMAGLLAGLLSGCAGGESEAKAADEQFMTIDHVVSASTSVSRPGLPTNTNYFTQVEIQDSLTVEQIATLVDLVVVVARDELASTASAGVDLHFYMDTASTDLKDVMPLVGDVGNQFGLSEGNLVFTREALQEYTSPTDSS